MAFSVNDLKKLSPQAKALIFIVIVFIIGYLYYFYFFSDVLQKKADLEKDYQKIQTQIKQKEKVVLQYDQYKKEVASLKDNYKIALLKLPAQREIPGLFHSVALAGRSAGVEFVLFEPKPMIPKTLAKPQAKKPAKKRGSKGKEPKPEPFYQEIPVRVSVVGNFQNIVHFFEKVAKLPRIVNVSDIYMGDRKEIKGKGYLISTSCTVKTYMFVDKQEKIDETKNGKK